MIISKQSSILPYLIIIILGAFIFIPFIGNAHLFDWDEANFAEAAREMLLTNNWMQVQINYEPFWEKPPLFIWLQALSMSVFGVNEFAARFPNAIAGIVTLCVLYFIGKKVSKPSFAWIWVMVYAGTWLPHFYFKTGIIDPIFNLFIFLSIYQLYNCSVSPKSKYGIWAGIFLGAAVLTKGPAAILIVGLCVLFYWIIFKAWKKINLKQFLFFVIASIITVGIWFGIDIIQNGWWFTQTFIEYQIRLFSTQDAGHGAPFYYHFLVLLVGCFPVAAFLFQYTWNKSKRIQELNDFQLEFGKWMQLLLWVNLILFSIVKTKIIHYSSLCYFPLSFLAAREIALIYNDGKPIKTITKMILFIIGALLAIVFIALPIVGIHIDAIIPIIDDAFTQSNLQAEVQWQYWEIVFGILFLLSLVTVGVLWKRKINAALLVLFLTQIPIIELIVAHFAPKVEAYSQGAAIAFYKSINPSQQVIFPGGFKSYAYLFYSNKQPELQSAPNATFANFENGLIDKEAFLIIRNSDKKSQEKAHKNLQLIQEKNGFILYKIAPSKSQNIESE